jgi:penicillin-binding protein 1A
MSKLFNISVKLILSLIVLFTLILFSAFWYFSAGLPDYKKLSNYEPPISSRVYSNNGSLVAEYAIEKRLFIPYEEIPEIVVNSFLSAEDKNFFSHPGVDAKGVLRALINNIKNIMNDRRLEGASTITQQVAKNFLLTNEISLKRKIKEAILAFRIERAYTKKRILELYLNQIYLGEGTYGVAAASLEYFDKSVKDLNYLESAMLAALPKAPSRYNPFKYPDQAKFRRDLVLNNLYENKFISKDEFKIFKKEKIKLKKREIKVFNEANSFTEEVRRVIKDTYGYKKLYEDGLYIKTPLNIEYQINALKSLRSGIESYDRRKGWRGPILNKNKTFEWEKKLKKINLDPTLNWKIAEIISVNDNSLEINTLDGTKGKIFIQDLGWVLKGKPIGKKFFEGDLIYVKKNKNSWSLKQYPEVNGGIVALNPYSGEVKALVGGFSFKTSEFNRVTQAKRQPGSAFKPFVYAVALENGYAPNSIILDAPYISEQGPGLKNWKPENYGKKFYGPSTLRKGIEHSRNLMTVRIAETLGLENILKLSSSLGIYDEIPELLSVSLGSAETTLMNLTAGYASFVNGGKIANPILINKIQDRRGNTIFNSEIGQCQGCEKYSNNQDYPSMKFSGDKVISQETAYQMTSILQGVIKRGTGKKLKDLKVPLAGKTGTTNNNFDAWFIGFSSDLVVGVYIGFDNPKTLGKYETGSKVALPIFKNFIKESIFKQEFKEFNIPENIYFSAIDYDTGQPGNLTNNKNIIEAFKLKDINSEKKINLKNENENGENNNSEDGNLDIEQSILKKIKN